MNIFLKRLLILSATKGKPSGPIEIAPNKQAFNNHRNPSNRIDKHAGCRTALPLPDSFLSPDNNNDYREHQS